MAPSNVPIGLPDNVHDALASFQPAGTVSVTVSVAFPTIRLTGLVRPEPTIV